MAAAAAVEAPPIERAVPTEKAEQLQNGSLTHPSSGYTISTFGKAGASDTETVDGSHSPAKTPFVHPTVASTPRSTAELTSDEQSKYASLLASVQAWRDMPDSLAAKAPKSPISEDERMWLTKECLLRYLRATKWNEAAAVKRLEATIAWRREWGIKKHTPDYISVENETGKQIITGFDNQGRPCLYLNPHKQNTKDREKQMHHLVFMLERCIDLMPPGQETLALLVNFKDSRKGENASIGQAKQTLYILQNHYPERLGKSYVQDVPWIIWGFFKAISPFIDPQTREKIKFDEKLRTVIPPEQLIKSYGGDVDFEYEHSIYWPAFNALAEARRSNMKKRWTAKGSHIGESEWYLKMGEDTSSVATHGSAGGHSAVEGVKS